MGRKTERNLQMRVWIITKTTYVPGSVISSKSIVAVYSDEFMARSRANFLQLQEKHNNVIYKVSMKPVDLEA